MTPSRGLDPAQQGRSARLHPPAFSGPQKWLCQGTKAIDYQQELVKRPFDQGAGRRAAARSVPVGAAVWKRPAQVPATKNEASRFLMFSATVFTARSSASRE